MPLKKKSRYLTACKHCHIIDYPKDLSFNAAQKDENNSIPKKEEVKSLLNRMIAKLNDKPRPHQLISETLKKLVELCNLQASAIYLADESQKSRQFKIHATQGRCVQFRDSFPKFEQIIPHIPKKAIVSANQGNNLHIFLLPLKVDAKMAGMLVLAASHKLFSSRGSLDDSNNISLHRQLQVHSHFIAQTKDILIVTNSINKIIYANNVTANSTGYSTEEILNKEAVELIPQAEHHIYKKAVSALQTWGYWNGELSVITCDNNTIPLQITAAAIIDPEDDLQTFIWTGYNLSNLRLWEKQTEAIEKYSILGEMAASIVHETRNPLTIVRGFLQFLSNHPIDVKHQQDYYKLMIEEVDRANKIINNYLNFARKDLPQENQFELNDLIDSTTPLFENKTLLRKVLLKVKTAKDKIPIYGDSKQLQQVFLNIMDNAIEAMPQGGILNVETILGKNAIVNIKDTGIGITKEMQKTIFEPFFTTKGKGTGLGLSISRRIIHRLDGNICVKSTPGKGTCFTISLPLYKQKFNTVEEQIKSGSLN